MLAIFVPAATSSTMVIRTLNTPATLTKLFGYFALVMVLLSMLIDYFKDYTRARSLGTVYIQVYGLVSILGYLQKSTRLCHRR
jgi:hypothetical protein